MGNSTAGDITQDTWRYTAILLPLPLIEVWIVNNPCLLLASTPREGRVTLRAPHLVAAFNLADHDATARAGATILGEKLGSRYILGLTLMCCVAISTLDLMALWARPL